MRSNRRTVSPRATATVARPAARYTQPEKLASATTFSLDASTWKRKKTTPSQTAGLTSRAY